MLLVKCEGNWADEFNVFGLAVMTSKRYKELLLWAEDASWMFGSNEGFESEDIGSFFSILSDDEYFIEEFINMMPKSYDNSWGQFPSSFDEE